MPKGTAVWTRRVSQFHHIGRKVPRTGFEPVPLP
jgi:hypothetical protein